MVGEKREEERGTSKDGYPIHGLVFRSLCTHSGPAQRRAKYASTKSYRLGLCIQWLPVADLGRNPSSDVTSDALGMSRHLWEVATKKYI
jgi:hypothetical protein